MRWFLFWAVYNLVVGLWGVVAHYSAFGFWLGVVNLICAGISLGLAMVAAKWVHA